MHKKSFRSAPVILLLFIALFFSPKDNAKRREPSRKISKELWDLLLKGGEQYGHQNASVTVVEFIDYQCPHCQRFTESLMKFQKNYPNKIRVIIHNFPLQQHAQAKMAAISAVCASKMGSFEKYHNLLFENQHILYRQPWDSLAQRAGVKDIKKFNGCIRNDSSVMDSLERDYELAMRIRLIETPTIIINRQLFNGDISYALLKETIQNNLKGNL